MSVSHFKQKCSVRRPSLRRWTNFLLSFDTSLEPVCLLLIGPCPLPFYFWGVLRSAMVDVNMFHIIVFLCKKKKKSNKKWYRCTVLWLLKLLQTIFPVDINKAPRRHVFVSKGTIKSPHGVTMFPWKLSLWSLPEEKHNPDKFSF